MSEGGGRLLDPDPWEDTLETASFWYDRWQTGFADPGEAEAFGRWIDRNTSHRRAFESIASVVSAFESPVTI